MKNLFKNYWKDESAQGMTEYILLLVAVVALVVMFKDRIKPLVENLMGGLEGDISTFSSSN